MFRFWGAGGIVVLGVTSAVWLLAPTSEEQRRNAPISASKLGYWLFPHP